MQSKKEVMDELTSTLKLVHEKTKNNMLRSIGWINIMDNTAEEFKHDIEQTRLFNELEAGWEYIIEYSYSDFQLKLLHHEVTFDGNDQPQDIIDQVFTLVKTAAPYLTTAEYASLYGVGETAVRNWLRRGKLRAAERVGNVWRIPALLTPPRVRGYQRASYSWKKELVDLHEEFRYINDYRSLVIEQDDTDKKQYKIYLYTTSSVNAARTVRMGAIERERLELMLISNPDVHYNARADEGVLADIIFGYDERELKE